MGSALPIKTAARTILTGTALLLLGACATVPVAPENDRQVGSAQILSICEKLAKSNDTRIAIGLCEKAHTEDPENPVPLLILGDMLQQQGALAQAGRAYGLAIELDPENVEAHYGLGKVFLARNQFELATEQFETARELNARDHRLYNALGVVLDNLGDHVSAQEHYRIGLELAPNNRALKKNLMLSRRLDDSVTTPAIGPRFEVVPGPASTPGGLPDGSGEPAIVPRSSPLQRPGSPGGRLGHEPLARAPNLPPQKNPFMPDTEVVAAQPASRQSAAGDRAIPLASSRSGADVIGPDEFPLSIEAIRPAPETPRFAAARPDEREALVVQAQAEAMDPIPAETAKPAPVQAKNERSSSSYLAYFPIVSGPQESVELAAASAVKRVAAEIPVIRPPAHSIRTIAAPAPAPAPAPAAVLLGQAQERSVEAGPKIIAALGDVSIVDPEILAEAPAAAPAALQIQTQPIQTQLVQAQSIQAQSIQTAALHPAVSHDPEAQADEARIDASQAGATPSDGRDRKKTAASTLVPMPLSEGFTAETPASSLLQDLGGQATAVSATQFAVEANHFGVARTALARNLNPAPEEASERPRVPRNRFGREHEDDHETRHVEGDFWDLVDVVNPIQHIPVVASIYRDVTDDEIKPAAKIAGGTLFGGVLGFASSIVDSVVEEVSGQNIGETAVAALSEDADPDAREAAIVRREREEAQRLLQESRR